MSLILEALRKSEAERRRGVAPDVAMELPPLPAPRSRALPAWLWPVLVLAGMAVLAAWLWSQRGTTGEVDRIDPVAAAPAPPPAEVPDQPVVIARPAAPRVVPPSVASPVGAAPVVPSPDPVAVPPPVEQPRAPPAAPPVAKTDVADIDAVPMPPVKLSMHIWDESPARRFVILDGQRMGEGDRNGDLRVVAIERDGVIVERNGARARVPLP